MCQMTDTFNINFLKMNNSSNVAMPHPKFPLYIYIYVTHVPKRNIWSKEVGGICAM